MVASLLSVADGSADLSLEFIRSLLHYGEDYADLADGGCYKGQQLTAKILHGEEGALSHIDADDSERASDDSIGLHRDASHTLKLSSRAFDP